MSVRRRYALDAGARRPQIEAVALEELASCPVEHIVIAVDVAQVDPGADDVAKIHAATGEQPVGRIEHVEHLRVGVAAGTVDVGAVERRLIAEADQTGDGAGAIGTRARRERRHVTHLPGVAPARNHRRRRELDRSAGKRRFLDGRRKQSSGAVVDCRQDAAPYVEHQRKVATDVAQEKGLGDEIPVRRSLVRQVGDQRAVRYLGLGGRVRGFFGPTENRELGCLGPSKAPEGDRAATQELRHTCAAARPAVPGRFSCTRCWLLRCC